MSTPIKEIMAKNLITIREDQLISDAYEIIQDKRIRHLPVVDSQGRVLGMLSLKDISLPESFHSYEVSIFASRDIQSVSETTPIRTAILKMLEKKISSLLVVNENHMAVGIVTTDDLLWHLAQLLNEDEMAEQSLFKRVVNRQTIGELINQLSLSGI